MTTRQNIICRLCLTVSHGQFVLIDENVREMLDVLDVEMNIDVSNDVLMCEDCAEIVKRSVSFKSVCLGSEEMILLFCTRNKNMTNVDLRDVYAHNSKEIVDGDTEIICRFCIKKIKRSSFIPLDDLMKQNTFSDMLKVYMFEMDLNIIKNPSICCHCRDNMESYFKLLQNCLDTEEKINTYKQNEKIGISQKIMLTHVFETFFEYPGKEELHNSSMEIKEEFNTEDEGVIESLPCRNKERSDPPSEENNQALKTKQLINNDEVVLNDTTGQQRTVSNMCICKTKVEMCGKCNSQFEILSKAPMVYQCKLCSFQGRAIKGHMLGHRNISEVQSYQCDSCEYQTKYKSNFSHHLLVHSKAKTHKCDFCEFRTKSNRNLKKHLLVHKDFSDVQIYECDSCKFSTKYKMNLKTHMLIHKEVQMFQCGSCEFKTKHRMNLKRHSLIHKDSSDIQIYECDWGSCEFSTKHKDYLKNHLLTHKNSDVRMYQCHSCKRRTKHKGSLKRHMLTHKDSSDVQMYQCDSCEFSTKHKGCLKTHLLTHKDSSDVQMYQCDSCEFSTKHKGCLKTHLLTHKNHDVQMYQCHSCKRRTKHKGSLKRHMLTHKDSSDVQMYQCDSCEFSTKHKGCLKTHLLTHKDSSDVRMYQCDNCEYRTKHKDSLRRHMLTHKKSEGRRRSVKVATH